MKKTDEKKIETLLMLLKLLSQKQRTNLQRYKKAPEKTLKDKIQLAVDRTLQLYLPTIAKDTGRLRAAITEMLLSQVNDTDAVVEFDRDKLDALLKYAKYHNVDDPSFNIYYDRDHYKMPTTAGTKPYSSEAIMNELKQHLEDELNA